MFKLSDFEIKEKHGIEYIPWKSVDKILKEHIRGYENEANHLQS